MNTVSWVVTQITEHGFEVWDTFLKRHHHKCPWTYLNRTFKYFFGGYVLYPNKGVMHLSICNINIPPPSRAYHRHLTPSPSPGVGNLTLEPLGGVGALNKMYEQCWENSVVRQTLTPTRDHLPYSPYCTTHSWLLIERRSLHLISCWGLKC